jgi:protein-S-isoprenylcysteine O-methyltransferase Ste14
MVKRKSFRILALIWSGILVLIIFPFGALILSLKIDALLNLSLFIPFLIRIFLAIISFVNGFFWAIWSNLELYHLGEGSPIPLKNTQTVFLVAGGPYKYSRNPMVF